MIRQQRSLSSRRPLPGSFWSSSLWWHSGLAGNNHPMSWEGCGGEEVASLQVSNAEALRRCSVHTDMLCCRSWDCHWLQSFLHLPLSLTRAGISPHLLLPSVFGDVGFHLFGTCMQIINILYWSTSLANSVSSHFYYLWLSFILSFKIFVSLYLILPSS